MRIVAIQFVPKFVCWRLELQLAQQRFALTRLLNRQAGFFVRTVEMFPGLIDLIRGKQRLDGAGICINLGQKHVCS